MLLSCFHLSIAEEPVALYNVGMPPAPITTTSASPESILNHTAQAVALQLLDYTQTVSQKPLSPKEIAAISADLTKIAHQYLQLNLPFSNVLYYVFEVGKARHPILEKAFTKQPGSAINDLKSTVLANQTASPQTAHQIHPVQTIEQSAAKTNQALKNNTPRTTELVQKIASVFSQDPQTLPQEINQKLAQQIIDSLQISAALNTDPETAIATTLELTLPVAYHKFIPSLMNKYGDKLTNLHLLTQEFLIKSTPQGWHLAANLSHLPTHTEMSQISQVAQQYHTSPLSYIIAKITPIDYSLPVLKEYQKFLPVEIISEIPSLHQAGIKPLAESVIETSFSKIKTLNQVSLSPPPKTSTTTTPVQAVISQVLPTEPFPPEETAVIAIQAPKTIDRVFAFLKPKNTPLFSPRFVKSLATGIVGASIGTVVGGGSVGVVAGSTTAALTAIINPSGKNLGEFFLALTTTPFIASSRLTTMILGGLSRSSFKNLPTLTALLTVLSTIGFGFMIHTSDLATFLQPLGATDRNILVNPPPRQTGFCWPIQLEGNATAHITVIDKYASGKPHRVYGYYDKETGEFHPRGSAVDIGADYGTAVRTPFPGKVRYAGDAKNTDSSVETYGNWVVIDIDPPPDHNKLEGFTLIFAHLATWQVNAGDEVKANQFIGTVNSTGGSDKDNNHLHYEIVHWTNINARINISSAVPDTPPLQIGSVINEANQCTTP